METYWIETQTGTGKEAIYKRERIEAPDSSKALRLAIARDPSAHRARVLDPDFMRKAHRAETIPDWYGAYLRSEAAKHPDFPPGCWLHGATVIDYRPEAAEKARRIPQKKQRKARAHHALFCPLCQAHKAAMAPARDC